MAVGKKITDLTASGSLKDTDLAIIHDGNGTKRSTLTQLSEYMGTKISNPNLLINPDFKINQRGKSEYTDDGYTVDRWGAIGAGVTVPESGGLTIHNANNSGAWITQKFEKELEGIVTLSIEISSINGKMSLSNPTNNIFITSPGVYSITLSNINEFNMYLFENASATIEWTKLEKGSIATPFVAPNPTEELAKCKRYASLVSLDSLMCLDNGTFCYVQNYTDISMRTNPTIHILSKKSNDLIIREEVTGNIQNKSLGEPTAITSLSNGKIVQFIVPVSNNSITMTTENGISVLLLDAEIY